MAAARKTKGPKPIADEPEDSGQTFMHEQREQDAIDERHGEASKSLKQTALYANELAARLAAARKVTSSVPAICHDLQRARELAALIEETAVEALSLYQR